MPALLADWVVGTALWKAAAAANVVAATVKVTVLMVILLFGKKDRRIGTRGESRNDYLCQEMLHRTCRICLDIGYVWYAMVCMRRVGGRR